MPSNDATREGGNQAPDRLGDLAQHLPGLIFQLYRGPDGHLHFPYLAGEGIGMADLDIRRLARDARPALERLDEADYPRLMVALERSARCGTPIATKFRFPDSAGEVRWIAMRARPEPHAEGVLWHGILLDISEQVAEEERLRRLSDTDDLTGLANRRRLMERLDEEISLSNRHATPLSLMMVDLDHFKNINDTWGHLQGDEVLKALARFFDEILREEDLVARLGGEEFTMILPLTPKRHAEKLAERLRERIATHDFGIGKGRVTVSIGIAEHRVGDSRDTLLHRADDSLYGAKHGGRNQVMTTP